MTNLFSLWALLTIPSCPVPLDYAPPLWSLLKRWEDHLFPYFVLALFTCSSAVFVYWAHGLSLLCPAVGFLVGVSLSLYCWIASLCSALTPWSTFSQDLLFPDLFAYVSFSCVRWPLAFFSDDPYQPALLFIDFSV